MLTLWVSRLCVERLQLLWRRVSLQTEAHFWRLQEWDPGDCKSEERDFVSRLFRNVSRLSVYWKSSLAKCRWKLHCKPAVKRASGNVSLVRGFSYVFDARRLEARFVWNATKTKCSAACEPDPSSKKWNVSYFQKRREVLFQFHLRGFRNVIKQLVFQSKSDRIGSLVSRSKNPRAG